MGSGCNFIIDSVFYFIEWLICYLESNNNV